MKKVVLTVVAAMAFTLSFAETKSDRDIESAEGLNKNIVEDAGARFDMSCDMRRLAVVLDLDEWQMEAVDVIQGNFNDEIKALASVRGPWLRHMVHQAVRKDAQQMRRVLNDKQFNTYMLLLGTTLRNKFIMK